VVKTIIKIITDVLQKITGNRLEIGNEWKIWHSYLWF